MSTRDAASTFSGSTSVISDAIKPGAIQLTRILRAATSRATDLEKPIRPALEAA